MSQRNKEFMMLYQEYRYKDQVKFYKERSQEFKDAHNQVLNLTGAIMFATALVSLATASLQASVWTPVLAILAIGLPALSTALAAYNELFAFERQSKLYQDAEKALHSALAESPDLKPGLGDSEYATAVGVYVNVIEGIFRKEQGQWGQLQSQAKMAELPAAKTTKLLDEEKTAEKETDKLAAGKLSADKLAAGKSSELPVKGSANQPEAATRTTEGAPAQKDSGEVPPGE